MKIRWYPLNFQGGGELDLLIIQGERHIGFEFKYSDAPTLTKSMLVSCEDLQLKQLYVIYPGEKSYLLNERIEVVGLKEFLDRFRTTNNL